MSQPEIPTNVPLPEFELLAPIAGGSRPLDRDRDLFELRCERHRRVLAARIADRLDVGESPICATRRELA